MFEIVVSFYYRPYAPLSDIPRSEVRPPRSKGFLVTILVYGVLPPTNLRSSLDVLWGRLRCLQSPLVPVAVLGGRFVPFIP